MPPVVLKGLYAVPGGTNVSHMEGRPSLTLYYLSSPLSSIHFCFVLGLQVAWLRAYSWWCPGNICNAGFTLGSAVCKASKHLNKFSSIFMVLHL